MPSTTLESVTNAILKSPEMFAQNDHVIAFSGCNDITLLKIFRKDRKAPLEKWLPFSYKTNLIINLTLRAKQSVLRKYLVNIANFEIYKTIN